jgi:hypothetical protein
LGWFSPPTSDDSSDETGEIFSSTADHTSSKAKASKSYYGKTQICENIYSKTYKKRQSYERKRDQIEITDTSTSKVKSLHPRSQQTIGRAISAIKSKRGRPKKPLQPLVIAKQLLEKAKGEKRLQLQKKEVKESGSGPVSRFGRTVKKKVLDYDDFTGGHQKRKRDDAEMPPLKAFKGKEGEWQLIRSGWLLGLIYPPQCISLIFVLFH